MFEFPTFIINEFPDRKIASLKSGGYEYSKMFPKNYSDEMINLEFCIEQFENVIEHND